MNIIINIRFKLRLFLLGQLHAEMLFSSIVAGKQATLFVDLGLLHKQQQVTSAPKTVERKRTYAKGQIEKNEGYWAEPVLVPSIYRALITVQQVQIHGL